MSQFNSIDEFLGHSSSSGGGYGKKLKSWTKNGSIRIWLHTRRLPLAVWAHSIPQLVVFEDRQTRESTKAYWGRRLVCWEDEAFLKKQYRRDETGQLDVGTPHHCAICRLIDVVYKAVLRGELRWTDEVFRFEGSTDPKNDQVIHAGGLTNMFGSDKLSREELRELKEAQIYKSEAWAQNFHAKLNYVFVVVNQDSPGDGVQIASQTSQCGDKVKKVIQDSIASLGAEAGNPMVNPYCVELTYDEKAPLNARYHARRIERIGLTPEVEKLIKGEPPNLTDEITPFNQTRLRAFLEAHAVVDLPWDHIFDVPKLVADGDSSEDEEEDEDEAEGDVFDQQIAKNKAAEEAAAKAKAKETKPSVSGRRTVKEEPPPPPPEDEEPESLLPCDKCGKMISAEARECPHCGCQYSFDGDDEDDEPEAPPEEKRAGTEKGDALPFTGGKKKTSRF